MHSILQVLPSEACYSVPCFLVGVDVWLEVVIDRQTYTILFDTGIILFIQRVYIWYCSFVLH